MMKHSMLPKSGLLLALVVWSGCFDFSLKQPPAVPEITGIDPIQTFDEQLLTITGANFNPVAANNTGGLALAQGRTLPASR